MFPKHLIPFDSGRSQSLKITYFYFLGLFVTGLLEPCSTLQWIVFLRQLGSIWSEVADVGCRKYKNTIDVLVCVIYIY